MKQNTKLPLIAVLALPILLIISTEVADISFNFMGHPIYLINFIFPLTFLTSILISKKTESKNAMTLVILALIIQSLTFVLKWALLGTINYALMEVTFFGFLLSQLLVLLGYEVLKEIKKDSKWIYVLFVLLLATLIETSFYVIVLTRNTMVSFAITVAIKIIYDLILAKVIVR